MWEGDKFSSLWVRPELGATGWEVEPWQGGKEEPEPCDSGLPGLQK